MTKAKNRDKIYAGIGIVIDKEGNIVKGGVVHTEDGEWKIDKEDEMGMLIIDLKDEK